MASEAGHWYTQEGTPAYTMIGKNGQERNTTLRDARTMNLVPSVTTIIRCASAFGLERWKAEQVLMAGLTLPRLDGEDEKAWIGRVWDDSKEQGKKAAERGTAIHAAIEGSFQGLTPPDEFKPYVDGALEVIKALGKQDWQPEKSFASTLGYGGKVDLHSPEVVLDFKTKDGDLSEVKCWDEHYMQVAAYDAGLRKVPDLGRCGIVFVSRTHPGVARLIMHSEVETARGWEMFTHLLAYWKAANRHGA